jgi:putative RecB family exonuclease
VIVPVPSSLSPTKVSAFTDCPLAFRFTVIDRLPEPPSPHAVKGTLVHRALEGLHWNHAAGTRTPAAADRELDAAFAELADDVEFRGLGLSGPEAAAFLDDARALVRNYFVLEDPDRVRSVGIELGLQTGLDGTVLRGIIDRLDRGDDGALVVVDYKTGRAPSARFEQARLTGVHVYALLCEAVLGRTPAEVRLLYLRDPVVITAVPSEQSVRGQHQRTAAVWKAITRACDSGDFRPRPSGLCKFCHFQPHCPAFGGEPPPLPDPTTA